MCCSITSNIFNIYFNNQMVNSLKEPRVLLGSIISMRHAYIANRFLRNILSLDYSNYDILMYETSKTNMLYDYIKNKLSRITIRKYKSNGEHPFTMITEIRNKFRDIVLKNYDYLFLIDSDTIIPKNSIRKLIDNNKDICGMVCPHGPFWYRFPYIIKNSSVNLGYVDLVRLFNFYTFKELKKLNSDVIECFSCGLSPLLISKKVLEKVKFRDLFKPYLGEDYVFPFDCKRHGFKIYCDLTLRAKHYNTGWEFS